MLRASRGAAFINRAISRQTALPAASPLTSRLMGTQSGDDAKPPTALAKLHLEDGTTLTGRSFGSHESVDGEVSHAVQWMIHFVRKKYRGEQYDTIYVGACVDDVFLSLYSFFNEIHLRNHLFWQVVFTTGMVGYPEALTDPSYQGQVRFVIENILHHVAFLQNYMCPSFAMKWDCTLYWFYHLNWFTLCFLLQLFLRHLFHRSLLSPHPW